MIRIYLSHNFGFLQRKTASDTQDCSLWGARESVTPPAFENFFLTQSRKKSPFQGYLVTRTIWKKTLRFPPFLKKN
jgi:hypothetical protein